jgi:lipoyl(octanoyl) transferase
MTHWRFLNTGAQSGAWNMAFDEELAIRLRDGVDTLPVLRVYTWQPYTISIGFNQQVEDFDVGKMASAGIDIVRRPTGGRAIFHAHELTYSVVIPIGERGPRAIYRFINEALLAGLHRMGISATLTSHDDNFQKLYKDPTSIPCFSSAARSEIQYDGRKLVGSAQRRFGNVILQHGSFLLGQQHRHIVDFLNSQSENIRSIIEEDLSTRTIEAETILQRPVTFEEAAESMKQGFEEYCHIEFDTTVTADVHA